MQGKNIQSTWSVDRIVGFEHDRPAAFCAWDAVAIDLFVQPLH